MANILYATTVDVPSTIDQNEEVGVALPQSFSQPPVAVTFIPTRSGGQSVISRVSYTIEFAGYVHMKEPDNGGHAQETVAVLFANRGSYMLDNGLQVEAKTQTMGQYDIAFEGNTGTWVSVDFEYPFTEPPVVLADFYTGGDTAEFATPAIRNVTRTGFEMSMENAGAGTYTQIGSQEFGWIAIQPFDGSVGGSTLKAEVIPSDGTNDGIDDSSYPFFGSSLGTSGVPIVQGRTRNDSDGYWPRGTGNWVASGVEFCAEEDQVGDSERSHGSEAYSGVYLESDVYYTGTDMEQAVVKAYDGSSWVKRPLRVWNGSDWRLYPVKYYDGSTWQT
jgi:hypothetical protein